VERELEKIDAARRDQVPEPDGVLPLALEA
jgi:hypothetical protein